MSTNSETSHLIPGAKNSTIGDANSSRSSTEYTRSGSHSLLKNITDFTCYEPMIEAQLDDKGLLTIYQAPCKDLKTKTFPISRQSLQYGSVNEPTVVLSEDFCDNYFIRGEIEVNVNATFTSASTDIYVCLFSDVEAFTDFTNYDKDWRQYVDKALQCNFTSEEQFSTTFKVVSPSYVFIAIASTNVLDTLQFSFNGTGQNFDQSTSDMTEVCSLSSDKPSESHCQFNVDGTSKHLCIIASNIAHADGSIDYFTVTLSFPHIKRHTNTGVGLTVGATVILLVAILFVIVLVAIRRKRRNQNS